MSKKEKVSIVIYIYMLLQLKGIEKQSILINFLRNMR